MAETQELIATGRRKTAVACIRMTPGNGKIDINGKSFEDYFPTVPLQNTVPASLAGSEADQCLRHFGQHFRWRTDRPGRCGPTRDFASVAPGGRRIFSGTLKAEGLLRRDPRMKERKKSRSARGAQTLPPSKR